MTAIERIVVAIDDESDEAVAIANGMGLAARHGARLLVYVVLRDMDDWIASLESVISKRELRALFVQHRRERLEAIVQRHAGDFNGSIDVKVEVTLGIPFVEIIRKAVDTSSNLIVTASRTRPSAGHLAFTSGDWHLMRKSPVPVWVVKGARKEPPRHVAVMLDVRSRVSTTVDFHRWLLEMAATIAERSQAKLSVFSAWNLPNEEMLATSPLIRISAEEIAHLVNEAAENAKSSQGALRDWLAERTALDTRSIDWHLEKGVGRELIPVFLNGADVDLAVLGTVDRTGIPGLLIGDTAETVLSSIACSVLTLKPSPFVSPVT